MTVITVSAVLYALLALGVAGFQLALVSGAPLGHLAMGGRFPGRFPPALRLAAAGQGALILGQALVLLGAAGLTSWAPDRWLVWAVVGLSLLAAGLNLATPSIPERRLWGPVAVAMALAALAVALA